MHPQPSLFPVVFIQFDCFSPVHKCLQCPVAHWHSLFCNKGSKRAVYADSYKKPDDQRLFLQLSHDGIFSVHLSLYVCWELTQGLAQQTKQCVTELSLHTPSICRWFMVLKMWAPSLSAPHASPSPLVVGRLTMFIAQAWVPLKAL